MFVGVGNSLVVLLAVLVLFGIGIRIAAAPEILDEVFTLFVRRQREESALLIFGDDVIDVRIEPTLVCVFQLRLDVLRI